MRQRGGGSGFGRCDRRSTSGQRPPGLEREGHHRARACHRPLSPATTCGQRSVGGQIPIPLRPASSRQIDGSARGTRFSRAGRRQRAAAARAGRPRPGLGALHGPLPGLPPGSERFPFLVTAARGPLQAPAPLPLRTTHQIARSKRHGSHTADPAGPAALRPHHTYAPADGKHQNPEQHQTDQDLPLCCGHPHDPVHRLRPARRMPDTMDGSIARSGPYPIPAVPPSRSGAGERGCGVRSPARRSSRSPASGGRAPSWGRDRARRTERSRPSHRRVLAVQPVQLSPGARIDPPILLRQVQQRQIAVAEARLLENPPAHRKSGVPDGSARLRSPGRYLRGSIR